ncbi:hypothetical protein ABC977_17495 [Thioalkalicoccus limnaeus]|uniref:Uncharacterized protein n=1 Tax=Thioalkalicoccus limnaeus TaxID=120681 RepID=A0ABV4BJP8_9GAMM
MNKLGLVVKGKKRFVVTTDSKHALSVAENGLNRDLAAMDKNRVRACRVSGLTLHVR